MDRGFVKNPFFCLIIGTCLALTIPLSAKEKFRARLINTGGPIQEKVMTLTISIENYTTADEVRQLQQTLYLGGYSAFLKSFHEMDKGVIRFKSGRGFNMRINAAQSRTTENGIKILVFTERQSWSADIQISLSSRFLFMVIELEIDKNGKIKGKFYPGANIQMSGKGTIDIESFEAPKVFMGVRKLK
ncbi:MAG: hypothetical protein U9Q97_08495 [Acidobacteriota bacterium]|nr:hypothetical protein [Acidobacteriota bacterium]